MALLSFCGFDTPSLPAQGEQRRSSYFNIPRGNSPSEQASHRETVAQVVHMRQRSAWRDRYVQMWSQ
jgi:hypothetical protein